MKAYICHYTPLVERKKYLESQLPGLGFANVEWVTEHDIAHYDISKVYDASPHALAMRNATSFAQFGKKKQRELRKPEIELTLQHFECYRRISEQNQGAGVIFEDDVVFRKSFVKLFDKFMNSLPDGWDVFYFGKGCGKHHAPMTLTDMLMSVLGKKQIFKNVACQSRFTDSYVVSRQAAQRFFEKGFPFHLPIDWELNYLQSSMNMNIYWSEPRLTFQGSKFGSYGSSLKKIKGH